MDYEINVIIERDDLLRANVNASSLLFAEKMKLSDVHQIKNTWIKESVISVIKGGGFFLYLFVVTGAKFFVKSLYSANTTNVLTSSLMLLFDEWYCSVEIIVKSSAQQEDWLIVVLCGVFSWVYVLHCIPQSDLPVPYTSFVWARSPLQKCEATPRFMDIHRVKSADNMEMVFFILNYST